MGMYENLRTANECRDAEWDPEKKITPAFRGIELAGEVGELCNVLKKLERESMGMPGSRASIEDLADELADVIICADLMALQFGINLEYEVPRKFNATSSKYGLRTTME